MKKQEQEYSSIPVEKQTELNAKITSSLDHLKDKDGFIDYKIDSNDWAVIKKILSTSIYTKPEAAIREIFNNALRQCRTAKALGANPHINIIFDVKNNRVVIEEIDSMGMTIKDFDNIYRHPSRSGNLTGLESGQFGIGKWAYLAISETMSFETFVRETNEKYGFLVQEKFVVIPDPEIKEFGTRVSFVINEGINFAALAQYASVLARFTQVKTFLKFTETLSGEVRDEKGYKNNVTFQKGVTQIGPVDPKEFLVEKLESKEEYVDWVEFDKPDYYLLMAFRARFNEDAEFNNLVGIPISLGENKSIPDPGFSGYILNIKDERKYPPVASRDQLKDESYNQLIDIIKKDVEDYFSKIDVRTIHDYKASKHKHFIDQLPTGGFDDIMPYNTRNFHDLLNLSVDIFDKGGKADWQVKLKDVLFKNVHLLCNYNKTMKRIEKCIEFSKGIVVLVPTGDKYKRQTSLETMQRAGIQILSEFMKEKGIKAARNEAIQEVAVRFGSEVEQMEMDDLSPNCLRISKDRLDEIGIKEFCKVLNNSEFNGFGMLRDQKKFSNTNSRTLEEFLRDTHKQEFVTSEGTLTGKEILEGKNDKEWSSIVILRAHKSRFAEALTHEFIKENTVVEHSKIYPDLIIIEAENETKPTKAQALQLAAQYSPEIFTNHFIPIGADLDDTIASIQVKPLKITVEGSWKKSPIDAIKHLGVIKNVSVREIYALSYSEIFENGDGWNSSKQKDIKICQELDELFLALPSTKTKMELSQILFEKFQEAEYGTYQREIRDVVKKVVIKGLKEIKNTKTRFNKVADLLLKDKVKNLNVKIIDNSYKDEIVLTFETHTDKKIKLNDDIGSLFNKVSDKFYSFKGVTIEGNKVEVTIH